jgi:prepilin-type N-terminal cleavage/methylation domain-containing protein
MIARNKNQKGFTLIEVIVTLILVGITAVLAGLWIVSVANGYLFARENSANVQKGQLAMTRLTKELAAIESVDIGASNATQITYTRPDASGLSVSVTIAKVGTLLQLNGNTLTDSVSTFTLSYCDDNVTAPTCSTTWSPTASRIIEVTLALKGAETAPFTKRIAPRNL